MSSRFERYRGKHGAVKYLLAGAWRRGVRGFPAPGQSCVPVEPVLQGPGHGPRQPGVVALNVFTPADQMPSDLGFT